MISSGKEAFSNISAFDLNRNFFSKLDDAQLRAFQAPTSSWAKVKECVYLCKTKKKHQKRSTMHCDGCNATINRIKHNSLHFSLSSHSTKPEWFASEFTKKFHTNNSFNDASVFPKKSNYIFSINWKMFDIIHLAKTSINLSD